MGDMFDWMKEFLEIKSTLSSKRARVSSPGLVPMAEDVISLEYSSSSSDEDDATYLFPAEKTLGSPSGGESSTRYLESAGEASLIQYERIESSSSRSLPLCSSYPREGGQNDERPLVTTKYGQLRGVTVPVKETSRVVDVFYGVPFAQPPVGPLRFANPEPAEPWSSVRDASEYPNMCIQAAGFMTESKASYQSSIVLPPISEDCLYLNVYTPANRDQKTKLPVMLYIHGGGLVFGTASTYDGSALTAHENVVVVSIQYRLGILGFLSTRDDQLPGNYGLQDQVAALRWVQENIADFGGDPESVTTFGESAGALSVSALMLSPLANGLFHRAIAESGAVTKPGFVVSNSEDLIPYQKKVAEISGCDLASIANCLKKKSEEEFLAMAEAMGMLPPSACVDGVFLPKAVEEILANKEGNKVPLLIGINNHEFSWMLPKLYNITGITGRMTRETMMLKVQDALPSLSPDVIPLAVDEYLGNITDPLKIRDRFLDLCGDVKFVIPALETAKYHQDMGLPIYFYEFQHAPTLLAHVRPNFVRGDHSDELIYVFGGPFLRDGAFYSGPATPEEKSLSKKFMKYWANFARTGNPNSPDLTTWPQYSTGEHYMEMNLNLKSSSKLKERKYKFWTRILPEKIQSQKATGDDRADL
ncbi:fatty acyl-CoA hydrolase precursor, medium chain-like [Bufo gargarizans]|uniref:fatty acyl-CoA hydrolase precursor, medium chain-like n=1 Tax=Bufo gargarizans TaxID=30331 RepID=UPI001CF48ACC|nr:fatty acyl-CoA hydrolase precursor, medium chain-like [Bufo gargarizans]